MQNLIRQLKRGGRQFLQREQQRRGFFILVAALSLAVTSLVSAQGMLPEARQNIHTLFNGHEQITRTLTMTEDGYEATTTSTNSTVAQALQDHVQQMQARLDSGLAVRRWDPAFFELRAYYTQIDVKIEPTEGGVKVVAKGQTPEAVKVAQNHAKVINEFVSDGWTAHNATHAAALTSTQEENQTGAQTGCCGGSKSSCGNSCGGCGSKSVNP